MMSPGIWREIERGKKTRVGSSLGAKGKGVVSNKFPVVGRTEY